MILNALFIPTVVLIYNMYSLAAVIEDAQSGAVYNAPVGYAPKVSLIAPYCFFIAVIMLFFR